MIRTEPPAAERPPRVSVIGAGNATPEGLKLAHELGLELGQGGALVLTGGLGGVMEASSRGCVEGGGVTVGLLPGPDPGDANPWVQIPIATGLGEARNTLVVRGGEATVAVGGEWGTLSEIALALKMGRKVALLGEFFVDLDLPRPESPRAAAAWALQECRRARQG
jgi:uncharacterized protein (TIGR00725 family)